MLLKKRLLALSLALLFLLPLTLPVQAAGETYSDLPSSHWAYTQMSRAVELGILNGKGNGRMAPSDPLTWDQYLAMLARAFAPDAYASATARGLPWDQAGFTAAVEAGLILTNDFLTVSADSLSDPITRQDVAVLLDRVIPAEYALSWWQNPTTKVEDLTDWSAIPARYRASVQRLCELDIIHGKGNGTFGGGDTLQRSDGSVLLIRALEAVDKVHFKESKTITVQFVDPSGAALGSPITVNSYIGVSYYDMAEPYIPSGYTVDFTFMAFNTVSSAASRYTLPLRAMTAAELEEAAFWDRYEAGEATLDEYYMMDFWLTVPGNNVRKHQLLYGNPDQTRYSSQSEAQSHMTTITVPIWKLSGSGVKTASTASFSIHEAIAQDVVAIFTEIYNDPEQFPISSVGGYSWRGDSATGEHNCGTAIDINPDANYQIRDGKVMVGSFWKPDTSPYSISPTGSVVRIFEEHGWSWGGDAWAGGSSDDSVGYHDYMHFSYMGG